MRQRASLCRDIGGFHVVQLINSLRADVEKCTYQTKVESTVLSSEAGSG